MTPALIRMLAAARDDARAILRDPLLVMLLATPPVTAVLLGLGLPRLDAALIARGGPGLAPVEPMILALYLSFAPALIGGIVGLLLVEERDAGALTALRATPQPFARLLAARLAAPCLLAAAITLGAAPLLDLGWRPDWPPRAPVIAAALVATGAAAPAALAILAFGSTKIAALVAFRIATLVQAAPALLFVAPHWAPLAWWNPSYWPMAALFRAAAGDGVAGWAPPLLAGVAVSVAATLLLLRLALRRARF